MGVFSLIVFLVCPLLSVPFIAIGLKKDKKNKKVYLALLSIIVALCSYCYRPTVSDDLYRHHANLDNYKSASTKVLVNDIVTKPEQLSTIYKYAISKTGNKNLLQFIAAIICYYILFYLLDKQSNKSNIPKWKKVGIWLFVLSGFHFLVITSGIFYTLALEILSLGIYLDYDDNKKIASAVCYIAPALIHTCAILPIMVIIIYKCLGSKITIKNVLFLSIFVLSISFLMATVIPHINNPITNELSSLYNSYFGNEEHWSHLHSPVVLALYLSRLVPIIIGYVFIAKSKDKTSELAIFMSLLVIVLFFQTSFSIRYIHIAVLCGIPLLFQSSEDKKYGSLFSVSLYLFSIPQIWYQIRQLSYSGGFEGIERAYINNLLKTLGGK